MRLDFTVILKCETIIIILSFGIKQSRRDLNSEVNYSSWAVFMRYGSYNANDGSAPFCIISFLVNYEFNS